MASSDNEMTNEMTKGTTIDQFTRQAQGYASAATIRNDFLDVAPRREGGKIYYGFPIVILKAQTPDFS
jgi:hypothetical protein